MKSSAKRLLSLVIVFALALSLLPGFVLAENETTLLAEGTATFATDTAAFVGRTVTFTTETNGDVTVEIPACTPGYYVDIYENGEWIENFSGAEAATVTFSVTGGLKYDVILCSYTVYSASLKFATAGSLSYKVTFVSNGQVPGGTEEPEEPEDPSLIPGATEWNPKVMTGVEWTFIDGGTTVWYLFDNYQNMMENGVYSMMLHVNSSADYSVTYRGQDVPVDENGFVNFEMVDMIMQGQYLFSVTNNSAEEQFFGIEVRERPVYVDNGDSLKLGNNDIILDTSAVYTLYEFSPDKTGVYRIKAAEGLVGNWGTAFNPVDNTADKTDTLVWTCTDVGQSVMIGFTGAENTTATVTRTGDYVKPEDIPWNIYENTYDFSDELDADAERVDVDLTDGGEHIAVLGDDGFYHYGSAEGPLMVADLSTVEINISYAYVNGGLRAWLMDENHQTISKNDYNEALYAYYQAGLVPVTGELVMMLQELGQANLWFVSGGLVFPEDAPQDLSMAWMQLCAYLVEPEGVTVSGSIITGAEGDTTLELISGEEVVATVTASGKEGNYSFENVAAGTYTLKVSKLNHVTREYTVTVGTDALTQEVKIHLVGDIDGNGYVNMGDVIKLNAHVKDITIITDEYALLCANVNGGMINTGDTSMLYAHVKGSRLLY